MRRNQTMELGPGSVTKSAPASDRPDVALVTAALRLVTKSCSFGQAVTQLKNTPRDKPGGTLWPAYVSWRVRAEQEGTAKDDALQAQYRHEEINSAVRASEAASVASSVLSAGRTLWLSEHGLSSGLEGIAAADAALPGLAAWHAQTHHAAIGGRTIPTKGTPAMTITDPAKALAEARALYMTDHHLSGAKGIAKADEVLRITHPELFAAYAAKLSEPVGR